MKTAKYTDFPEKDNPHKVSVRMIYDLSLIHISEPTRPY